MSATGTGRPTGREHVTQPRAATHAEPGPLILLEKACKAADIRKRAPRHAKQLRVFLANVGRRQPMYPLATPPMGLMYLAAYLRTKFDVDIRVVNQRCEGFSDNELVWQAVDHQADVVGFSALTPAAHALGGLTRKVRQALPNALILLGGPHVSAFRERALEGTEADAAVVGEGELALEMIVNTYLDDGDLSKVPGLIWRDADRHIMTNPGFVPHIADLDSLPFPAYDLIDVRKYWRLQSMPPIPRRRYASIVSSRGCPYHCNWCHRIFGKRFRAHSAERVVDEIEYYMRTLGIDDVEFIDDIFNHDRKRVIEFSRLVGQRDLRVKIAFPNAIRADALNQDTVDALADAGTYFCSFSLESGSPRLQKLIGKHLDIPRFLKGIEMAVQRGIFANGFNMLGFPTETEDEMQQTIDVARHSLLHTASFFTVTPFPNTELHDLVQRTHPEKLANISYADTDFSRIGVNLAAVPDEVLFYYQRRANRQFFMNPVRLLRIVRDFPQPHLLPFYIPIFANRLTKGLFTAAARSD